MKNVLLTIKENRKISKDIYLMRLEGDLSEIKNPGEFVEIKLDNYYLRRPISVHDFSSTHLDLLYKVLGNGTLDMSKYENGKVLDVLIGLGNGFNITNSNKLHPCYGSSKVYNIQNNYQLSQIQIIDY